MKYMRYLILGILVAALVIGSAGAVAAKGPPEGSPGKGRQGGHGSNQSFIGNVTSITEGNLTMVSKQSWQVILSLTDSTEYMVPSVTKGKVGFSEFLSGIGGDLNSLEGDKVVSRATGVVEDPSEVFVGEALRVMIYPRQYKEQLRQRARLHAHRTGVVTAFSTEGDGNITIVDVHGLDHSFVMSGNETVYRPQGTAAYDIAVDESFVTVVTTGDPKLGPPARAIVLHERTPEGWPGWSPTPTPAPGPTPEPAMPDLVITEKHEVWSGSGGNATYTVFYTVKNAGNATAPAGHNTGLIVDGASMEPQEVTVALAAGEEHSDSFGIVLELTGDSDEIEVCADVDSEVAESDETNNCQPSTVTGPG